MRERIKDWWHDYVGAIKVIAVITGIVVGVLLLAALIVLPFIVIGEKRAADACEQHAEELNTEHRYSMQLGCRIKLDDGRWIPLENYRHVEDQGER